MNEGNQEKARRIALDAEPLRGPERATFLTRECGHDERLRAEVEAILEESGPVQMPAEGNSTHLNFSPASPLDLETEEIPDPRDELRARKAAGTPRYDRRGEVGRGGMGAVLKVFDSDLRRSLAMKVILRRPGPHGESSVPNHVLQRFLEEAQVTGQLEHPGIVPVHEIGLDDEGAMYFTMRLVRGRSFDEVIAMAIAGEEGWNIARALGSLLKVCETLAYAHSRRVIHRDLKPANIMLGRFGETYVMDWGAARILDLEESGVSNPSGTFAMVRTDRRDQVAEGKTPSATQEGSVIGTPFYMPREQAAGLLDEIGPHSDVYAVGCMLYQLLSGHRPYERKDRKRTVMEVVSLVMTGPPEPLGKVAPSAPAELVAICEKAMEHDWRDRYPTMLQMADDLRAHLEGRVVRAYQTGAVARAQKWVGRNRALAASLAASIVLALSALIVVVVLQGNKLQAVQAEQTLTAAAREEAIENEQEAKRNAALAWHESYVANVIAADASLRANEIREGKRLLAESREELRGWEWRHVALVADSSTLALAGHSDRVLAAAYDPSGKIIASSSRDGTVRLWNAEDGSERAVLSGHTGEVVSLAFGADGRQLFTFGGWADATMRTWDVAQGALAGVMQLPAEPSSAVVMSPDHTLLAFGITGNAVSVVDATTGLGIHELEGSEEAVHSLSFGPRGAHVFVGYQDGVIRRWNLATGDLGRSYEGQDGSVFGLAVHPSKDEFLTGAENGVVRRWEMETGSSEVVVRHDEVAYGVAYGPAGRWAASVSFDKVLTVVDLEGGRSSRLFGHDQPVRCLSFTPDGERLVTGGDDAVLRTWAVRNGEAVLVRRGTEDYLDCVAAAPVGRRVAIAGNFGGTIQILDATGNQIKSIAGADDPVNDLAYSQNERWLAAAFQEEACVRIYTSVHLGLVRTLTGHESSVTSVAFRPNEPELASGSTDFTVKLWSVETGEELHNLTHHEEAVHDVVFDPRGDRLAGAFADGLVLVWNAETGEPVRRLEGHAGGAYAIAWSPDGAQLAVAAADHRLWIWGDADAPPNVLEGHDQRLSSVAFSPDGARIVTGSYDASIRVWDAKSLEPLLSLRGHEEAVTSVIFTPDGEEVLSTSFDNTVRFWRSK